MKSKQFTATAQYLYLGASEDGASHSVIQVVGAMTGTLQFEASQDGGTTYVAVQATNLNTGGAATSATAAGIFRLDTSGFLLARVNCTALSSGTPTVYASSTGG